LEPYDIAAILIIVPFLFFRFIYRIDSRIIIGIAIVILVATGISLAAGSEPIANDLAIVAFYCLVVGVLLLVIEYAYEERKKARGEKPKERPVLGDLSKKTEGKGPGGSIQLLRPYLPYAFFLLLALLILGPLLAPGYVLSLDMIFTPHMSSTMQFYGLTESLSASLPMSLLLDGFSFIPMWLIQKLILIGIIFLSAVGMYRLMPSSSKFGRYFAAFLYAVNPFVYVRFLAGHWALLLGYALLPFALKYFISMLENPPVKAYLSKTTFVCLFFYTVVGIFDLHMLFILLGLSLILLVIRLVIERKDARRIRAIITSVVILSVFYVAVNAFWLFPVATTQGTYLQSIGTSDLYAYAPVGTGGFGAAFSLASMYGFWRGGYSYTMDFLPGWYLIFAAILFLAILGFLFHYRDKKLGWTVVGIGIGAVVAFVFALGVSSSLTEPFSRWLFDTLPFMRGFRDSQKFVAVLVLAYSFLGGLGVDRLFSRTETAKTWIKKTNQVRRETVKAILLVIILTLPFLYSITMFWGFGGQLNVTDYPSDWYETNNYFEEHPGDYAVLFLPWHMYMDFSFAGRRLANPAASFFTPQVIQGENVEMGGVYSESNSPSQAYVQFLIDNGEKISNMGSYLSLLDVKYVILAKEVDYYSYSFLFNQTDLRMVSNTTHLYLFENEVNTSRLYSVDYVNHISSLNDLLTVSRVSGGAFQIGQSLDLKEWNTTSLSQRKVSEVEFDVTTGSPGSLVYVPKNYDPRYWRANGNEGKSSLGFAFVSSTPERNEYFSIWYSRSGVYYASYTVSALSAFLLALYFVWRFDTRIKRSNLFRKRRKASKIKDSGPGPGDSMEESQSGRVNDRRDEQKKEE
jgi:hypothetical protein